MTRILQPIQSTWLDYPDNESLAIIVCMMGCDNGCFMCQNPDFQNPYYLISTKEYTVDSFIKEIEYLCERNKTNKLVMSGGDPLAPCNIEFTKEFLSKTSLDVCIYTGHSIEHHHSSTINSSSHNAPGIAIYCRKYGTQHQCGNSHGTTHNMGDHIKNFFAAGVVGKFSVF